MENGVNGGNLLRLRETLMNEDMMKKMDEGQVI